MTWSLTPRQQDCLDIQKALPGWGAKFLSLSHNYAAMSPDYNEKRGTGVVVVGRTVDDLIKSVQLLHVIAEPVKLAKHNENRETYADPKYVPEEKVHTPDPRLLARQQGFTGDTCVHCQSMRVRTNGTCHVCADCGETTGCS